MRNLHEHSTLSYVTALFADRTLSFALPRGATLQDLAERLTLLGKGEPLTVTVKLDSQREPQLFPFWHHMTEDTSTESMRTLGWIVFAVATAIGGVMGLVAYWIG